MPGEPEKINDYEWEIPADQSQGMRVPVRIYANERILGYMKRDRTLRQAANAAKLPSIVSRMMIMPDGHEGYGFPIGGVAAFDADDGIVSPAICGFDINCGVKVVKTNLTIGEVRPKLGALMDSLFKNVPSGVGSKVNMGFTQSDLKRISEEGVPYILSKGYGFDDDVSAIEEGGFVEGADISAVSPLAKKRGVHEIGTLGAGNHFLEVQKVDRIIDAEKAGAFGLEPDQVVVMVHCGSRGFGHQICSDSLRTLSEYQQKNGITLDDPELSYAYVGTNEAENYLKGMRSAINFAFVNRQVITHSIRKSFSETFGRSADALGMEILYDVAHNIIKLEEHVVDGKRRKLHVHRKGATRAFGPGQKDVPQKYRMQGQPVLIPGSMGTASYVLAGRKEAMEETFGSSCHGSGRVMSRHQAIRDIPAKRTLGDLASKNIELRVRNRSLISEEAEWAYKDVDDVVASISSAKVSDIVARLVPIGVAKG